ncbi:MAG: sugar ABC transporter ATP-binding protein [Limisphaerales bacterium]
MTPHPTTRPVVLRIRQLSKSFPGVRALDDVTLEVRQGEIHAVMGENGAGKSTLMKLLAGLEKPDAGEIHLHGQPVHLSSPHDALKRGIAMIHQELMPFPHLTVGENVLMGQEPTRGACGWVDRRELHSRAGRLLDRLGVTVAPTARMGSLSVGEMQVVEIAKALAHEARVLIMDEPTSALSEREVEKLFTVIRDLRRDGVAILYISHKLEEVFALADRVTVLRDGRHVGTHAIGELDAARLMTLMVGREVGLPKTGGPRACGEVALAVRGLGRSGRFRDVTFAVRRGEVLGFAGLMGAGRTEVVSALYGLPPADSGEIRVRNRVVKIRSPRDALAAGIAMVTEDRQVLGLVPSMSVRENLTLSTLNRVCRGPWIDRAREDGVVAGQIERLGIKVRDPEMSARTLSGGNQQKLVLARALLADPEILILDEPTRGIDVGAKAEIHALVRRLADEGKAILLVSSELPELLSLSDRLVVLREGRIAAQLDRIDASPEVVLRHAVPR